MNQALYESLSKKAAQLMPKDRLTPYDYKLYMEILAELIVRECARKADQIENYVKTDNSCGDYLKKHFGIEE
jgi:hypothetical protein